MDQETETTSFHPGNNGLGEALEQDPRWPIQWTNRLQRLAATLSGVVDPAAMAREAVAQGRAALEASAGAVFLLSSDGEGVDIAHASGYPSAAVTPWGRFSFLADVPVTDAIRTQQIVLVQSRDEMRRLYPALTNTPSTLIHES